MALPQWLSFAANAIAVVAFLWWIEIFLRSRLRVKSTLSSDGTAVTVTIINNSRAPRVIDAIVVSSPDGSAIAGVRYDDFADGSFKAIRLAEESSANIVVKAPEGQDFEPGIRVIIGLDGRRTKTSKPSIAAPPTPSGSAGALPSDEAGPRTQKLTRSPLTYLQALTLAFLAIAITTGIVYLLLSGIALKSHQATSDYSRLERAAVQLLLFGAAIGVTAMAVIEVIKRATPVRAVYHVAALSKRLGPDSFDLLREVITARQRNVTFFDLPIEQLTGQIGAALDQIVANIEAVPIAWNPELEQGTASQPVPPVKQRLELLNAVIGRDFFVVTEGGKTNPLSSDMSSAKELRRDLETTLRSALDAGLDNIQLSVGYGWKRLVRLSAALVSAVSAVAISALNGASYRLALFAFLGAFIVGGFFSWLSRDLVAAVERWRR